MGGHAVVEVPLVSIGPHSGAALSDAPKPVAAEHKPARHTAEEGRVPIRPATDLLAQSSRHLSGVPFVARRGTQQSLLEVVRMPTVRPGRL